jgi:CRISPR-associated protein Cas6
VIAAPEPPVASMVDLVFPLAGHRLPCDHRLALADAVEAAAPVLSGWPAAGLHPVDLLADGGEAGLLSQRAKLTLRVPRAAVAALERSLAGRVLDVGGYPLRLGLPHARELLPHGTLYARFVVIDGCDDEGALSMALDAELDALGAACQRIWGRRQRCRGPGAMLFGYSLMLHGLGAAPSLRVLEAGVGRHRRLGAGVFVPHRSATAVGA